ncbi:lysine--tRNA ligase [Candidatus Nomurabacteria bacterium]|nr:lysine--tRNA ligase [Candidatus Nomurabacteria bacterium]
MASLEEIRVEREKKVVRLLEVGLDPYPIETVRDFTCGEVLDSFAKLSKRKKLMGVSGRVRAIRGQGAIMFMDLDDGTGRLQLVVRQDDLAEEQFQLMVDTLDIGDFVEAHGSLLVTKRGEKSLVVKSWRMLTKSLRPLPDKWHGLQDVEERFRRRYLDILMSPEVKERFLVRSKIVSEIRSFLDKEGFLEVETPVLQPIPGGASAAPFITHHEALDTDLFLRISEELYLKRLLVGGFPKVYSLSRNFRNEGIDTTHNPEFTMLEWYEAYSNATEQQKFVFNLLKVVVKKIFGGLKFKYAGDEIDLAKPVKVVSYYDLLKRHALITDPASATREELLLKASQLGVKFNPGDGREKIMDVIYKKVCRPKLIQPTFLVDFPVDYLPLAKKKSSDNQLVDAFQLVIGGVEIVKAFSELNDPVDQRARFEAQEMNRESGDNEAQRIDEDFLEALEYGMPPAGGVGIGIDRLTMLLTDTQNIKEVILFPTLKPRGIEPME